jgi:hypothetical protein
MRLRICLTWIPLEIMPYPNPRSTEKPAGLVPDPPERQFESPVCRDWWFQLRLREETRSLDLLRSSLR